MTAIAQFIERHFRHFNAGALRDAAAAYSHHVGQGGKIVLALAGAMSTAELGVVLAEMIRRRLVHAVCTTGANLEEDVFNLVAHDHYRRVPHYRDLTPADEQALLDAQLNRVTDTCIPEAEAMRRVENVLIDEWIAVEKRGERLQPHQFFYRILLDGRLERFYQIDPRHSWLLAAAEQNLPIFAPGWEDSTIGNVFAARCLDGRLRDPHTVCSGIENLVLLVDWYRTTSASAPMGLVQIGGGIAGDFSIAVVPLLRQDLREERVPLWKYFCQISDSTTSYGSYSGAVPNEKITWGKLGVDTPRFVIESDATIAAPLLFARVLGW